VKEGFEGLQHAGPGKSEMMLAASGVRVLMLRRQVGGGGKGGRAGGRVSRHRSCRSFLGDGWDLCSV
jgi:hypothetical protein